MIHVPSNLPATESFLSRRMSGFSPAFSWGIAVWLAVGGGALWGAGLPLTESTFTEIIQEAKVVVPTSKVETPAKTNELFKAPDLVRTGQESRVELTAKDLTITRIGANTVFSFATGGRDIRLHEGSVLFHSPAGAGGGAIKNRGTSAAVLGTTELGVVMLDGRFKIIDLEGTVRVTLRNGLTTKLSAGQVLIVAADGDSMGSVGNFNLGAFVERLELVTGFSNELSSLSLIKSAVEAQNQMIEAGLLTDLIPVEVVGIGLELKAEPVPSPTSPQGSKLPNKPTPRSASAPRQTPRAFAGFADHFTPTSAALPQPAVSNLGNVDSGGGHAVHDTQWLGMSFTVGSGFSTWTLDDVKLRLSINGPTAHDFALELHSKAAGTIGLELGTFSSVDPGGLTADYTFTPKGTYLLSAGNTYWITARSLTTGGGGYIWSSTTDPAETGLPGWSIGDEILISTDHGITWNPAPGLSPAMLAINAHGTPSPAVPEPATLFTLSLASLALLRRRR